MSRRPAFAIGPASVGLDRCVHRGKCAVAQGREEHKWPNGVQRTHSCATTAVGPRAVSEQFQIRAGKRPFDSAATGVVAMPDPCARGLDALSLPTLMCSPAWVRLQFIRRVWDGDERGGSGMTGDEDSSVIPNHWPDSLDAMTAAPDHHEILLENDRIGVLDTRLGPGERTPVHTHRWPSVLYVLSWSDIIRCDVDGNVLLNTRTVGSKPNKGATLWLTLWGRTPRETLTPRSCALSPLN